MPRLTTELQASEFQRDSQSFMAEASALASRYGVIEIQSDNIVAIRSRIFPKIPSRLEAWFDANWRRLPDNWLQLYYNAPKRCPGFLVLAYARAGRRTSVAVLRTGLRALDEIAVGKQVQAIVCETTNPKLNERVMRYFGYVRHAPQLKGYHYIKRFIARSQ